MGLSTMTKKASNPPSKRSRARVESLTNSPRPRASREEADRRVNECATAMVTGAFDGRWVKEKAAEWGIQESSVRNISAEASRLAWRAKPEDIHAIKAETLSRMDSIATKAEADGDYKTALLGLDKRAEIAGAKPMRGTDVTVNNTNVNQIQTDYNTYVRDAANFWIGVIGQPVTKELVENFIGMFSQSKQRAALNELTETSQRNGEYDT